MYCHSYCVYSFCPQLVDSITRETSSDVCMVYKPRCERIVNHCTQYIYQVQTGVIFKQSVLTEIVMFSWKQPNVYVFIPFPILLE